MSLTSQAVTDFGSLALQRGASVAGWVETEDSTPLGESCVAKLTPQPSPSQDAVSGLQVRRMSEAAEISARGFFHFRDLKPAPTSEADSSRFTTAQSVAVGFETGKAMRLAYHPHL